ncbi:MAG: ATP-binding cassette domain-containing protein [Solirubrobacterales bacterium]
MQGAGEKMADSPNGTTRIAGEGGNGIEASGLAREFKGGVTAVDGIDLEVRPGEIYGFLGPNGAGKSTTVHMLTTLLPPSAGSARVAGHDVTTEGAAVRDAIGAALQEAALDPQLSAREHMRLQGALHGIPKEERTRRSEALIERVGLTEAADRKVAGYSGGMKRRLDLALALLHHPRVLFLDEPTTGLDIQSRTALWDEIAHLSRDEGVTVFLTTQYLEEADQLADRVGIIDRGTIVAEGAPQALKAEIGRPTVEVITAEHGDRPRAAEVLERFGELVPGSPKGESVRLSDGVEELAEIVRALDGGGIRVANLELHAPSLNDVFLAQTGRSLEGAQAQAEGEPGTGEQPVIEGAPA